MPPHISIRDFIRMPASAAAEEPTSTLVLTSSQNRFVDIRILKEGPSAQEIPQAAKDAGILPLTHLDWAFAGVSFSSSACSASTTPCENGAPCLTSIWKHHIDSRHVSAERVVDEGHMFPQPDGRTLEKGCMPDPRTGNVEAYEEMWRDVEVLRLSVREDDDDDGVKCAVLQMEAETGGGEFERARGMVVRVGRFVQGVVRVDEGFALERWEWKEKGKEGGRVAWEREVRMGDLFLPCGPVMENVERLRLGGKVSYQGFEWTVVELEEW